MSNGRPAVVKLLIVDDSPSIRLRIAAALKQVIGGPTLLEAQDAEGALVVFAKERPDIVFLDMMLAQGPGGLHVLKGMLAQRPDARIVLVTSLPAGHPDMIEAIGLGAVAHLPKPVTNDAVKRVLDQLEGETGRMGRIR
jgi:ActR/RegA family two-component response regulator